MIGGRAMKSLMYFVTFLMVSFAVSPVAAQAGGDPQEGLTEFTGTDIPRAGYRSRYDGRRLNGGTYDAPCGDAYVHVYG
jgi:hypothetical protein